jgi:L,D-peptidoglycan transpeptidase YkuD (ErfK/YbiS/YcfS/YnhG family)
MIRPLTPPRTAENALATGFAMLQKTFLAATLIALALSISMAEAAGFNPYFPVVEIINGIDSGIPGSSQALLAINKNQGSILASVYALEKKEGRWIKTLGPFKGSIGKNGFAPPGEKREGDGKSPSGVFLLGTAFGYSETPPTRMPYRQAAQDDLWVDDINAPDYNRWVKKDATRAASFEVMRRKDNLYEYGIVVEYNTRPVVKGMGSAIFIHVHRGEGVPTAGCVALAKGDLLRILQWLDPKTAPVIVMGTEKFLRGKL